jgi:hypothetical protein
VRETNNKVVDLEVHLCHGRLTLLSKGNAASILEGSQALAGAFASVPHATIAAGDPSLPSNKFHECKVPCRLGCSKEEKLT